MQILRYQLSNRFLTVLTWLCSLLRFTQNCEPAFYLCFDGLHFDVIRSNCEYVIHPDVALCG